MGSNEASPARREGRGRAVVIACILLAAIGTSRAGLRPGTFSALVVDRTGDVVQGGSAGAGLFVARMTAGAMIDRWRRDYPVMFAAKDTSVSRIAVDGGGGIFVASVESLYPAGYCPPATVLAVAGGDGAERWRAVLPGGWNSPAGLGCFPQAPTALAVDPNGDVVVALTTVDGWVSGRSILDFEDVVVVKLDGRTGAERWRFRLDTGATLSDRSGSLAVDGRGDVFLTAVASPVSEPVDPSGERQVVIALAGDTGTLRWQRSAGSPHFAGEPGQIVLDPAGDVVVTGRETSTLPYLDVGAVTKLAAEDGSLRWQVVPGTEPPARLEALAVDRNGDVLVGGYRGGPSLPDVDMVVLRLDGVTGAERWRRVLAGTANTRDDVRGLAIDGRGDVWAAGILANVGTCYDLTVVRLDGSDGRVLSLDGLDGTARASRCDVLDCPHDSCLGAKPRDGIDQDEASSIAIDPGGAAVITGALANHRFEQVVLTFSDRLTGSRLTVHEAGRPRVRARSTDARILAPLPGGPGDPTRYGALLDLVNPITGETARVALARRTWSVARDHRTGEATYRARGQGACRVTLRSGRLLDLRCDGRGLSLPATASGARRLALRLRLGTGSRYCLEFGGTLLADTPTHYELVGADAPMMCD